MVLANISVLEWILIGLGGLAVVLYITISIYKAKHPRKKKVNEEDE